jgi:GH25 family lysozyme M1 (1,4-beta-N-acetylmuramidase)
VTEGLDLYTAYQAVTDWAAVRAAGKEFCYIKVSDGRTRRSTFDYGPAGKRAGLAMGAYHFAQPGDPIAQAELLVQQATACGLTDLGPALDLESPFVPGPDATQFAIAFLRRVANLGHLPVFYANDSLMGYLLPAVQAAVPAVWPWVARYGARPSTRWRTWQHTDAGHVPGVTATAVDLNIGQIPHDFAALSGTINLEDDLMIPLHPGAWRCTCADIPPGKTNLVINVPTGMLTVHSIYFAGDDYPPGDRSKFDWKGSYEDSQGYEIDALRPWLVPVPPGATNFSVFWSLADGREGSLCFR